MARHPDWTGTTLCPVVKSLNCVLWMDFFGLWITSAGVGRGRHPSNMRSISAVLDDLEGVLEELSRLDVDGPLATARYTVLERLETAARRQSAVSPTPWWPAPSNHPAGPPRTSPCPTCCASPAPKPATGCATPHSWPRMAFPDRPAAAPAAARHRHRLARRNPRRRTPRGHPTLPARTARRHRPGADRHRRAHPGRPGRHPAPRSAPDRGRTDGPDLNPDGKFSDQDRALQRVHLVRAQRPDAMSTGKLIATRSCGPNWTPGSPSSPHPAWATPTTTPR